MRGGGVTGMGGAEGAGAVAGAVAARGRGSCPLSRGAGWHPPAPGETVLSAVPSPGRPRSYPAATVGTGSGLVLLFTIVGTG